ncbi:ATP-grasp domain-containing protein [Alicyclobacillus tolerans]|uniref:ATP-grasp domain-containing protein n=1 Tax=Alicyclobacillus tolerans TaxID=90970 RepID=UPI001F3B6811|nr:ATP-grasp domain-containing protein [Alicyclobacillus tolerans]MCF8566739.1 ATP-grasp domain-containing protein [Alicyclobacillus tolerans]
MQSSVNVLVTGSGSPGAPGIIKSLRAAHTFPFPVRVIGVDVEPNPAGRYLADRFFPVPAAQDAKFIDALLEICRSEQVHVVLPMVSAELFSLSKHKSEFAKAGTRVSVSKTAALSAALDKGKTFAALSSQSIAVPKYALAQTVPQLHEAIRALGYPKRPVCFKPVVGDGSRGFKVLDTAVDWPKRLFQEKPDSTYISERELFEVLGSNAAIPELMVMEFLPNEEYSVDLFANEGDVMVAVPRRRDRMVNGITTRGTIEKDQQVIDTATAAVRSLGLHGNIGVQVRKDANGTPKVIEVNPRLQGTTVHSTAAGVNLPLLAVKLALGLPIQPEELRVKWGTAMTRYWEEVFYDANGQPFRL